MFVNYWIIIFSSIFFPVYWLVPLPSFRKMWLLLACLLFHYKFAGPAGVIPIIIMGVLTYVAGILKNNLFRKIVITICILELIFYKYSTFFLTEILKPFDQAFSQEMITALQTNLLPELPPLAISFFVFEFVHYLVDLIRGKQPIYSVTDFTLFSVFWPSVVAGPVKRFEQFLPAVVSGCKNVTRADIQIGITRVLIGFFKKLVIAENLTRYIDYWQMSFDAMSFHGRWLLVIAISLRILFDFSGYSDIAIGLARMMGIRLPENFRWPYLATNLQAFWQRWHISLSTWIRDYIYIPLGGNMYGRWRRFANALIAFTLCGLWHGAAGHYIFWGLYHGIGLVVLGMLRPVLDNEIVTKYRLVLLPFNWLATFIFVSIGWLFFFYPVSQATNMLLLLLKIK